MSEFSGDITYDFAGRAALVTGAGAGIGRAVAPACGHFLPEERPNELANKLFAFHAN